MIADLWRFLHLLFAFSFVGAVTVAEWNGRAARGTADWSRRAALWAVVRTTSQMLGLGSLVLLGIFGNMLAVSLGLPMGGTWMRTVNALFLGGILLYVLLALPAAKRLVAACEAAQARPEAEAVYAGALRRWRVAGVLASVFYLAMLVLMVLRPRFA
jgi:uncharacterized membrane protein